ncbi:MAG TPA: SUMF1/EgtB/PvdO family nonheme iron enzyme, partial [Ohtaekwangia sp.]
VPYFPYKLNAKSVEARQRKISPTIYASEFELINEEYNRFLSYLIDHKLTEQYERYKFDLSRYDEPARSFMIGYSRPVIPSKKEKYFTRYPAVSLPYEGAVAYCEWLTEQYNNTADRKYKKVKFRLPTLKEWQIAALGNPKFTTWELDDNIVKVSVPKNDTEELSKDFREVPVKGNDIQYPWYGAYNYRNKALNSRGCALGNFKFPDNFKPCASPRIQNADGWNMMGPIGTYFPNGAGLFDVVGNVAEMIDEKGKACGGSWNHVPEESTIRSINTYDKPDAAVGFRVFMEIIEQ